jgi:hypothetical protein
MTDLRISEIVLTIGLSAIAYFLKLIHTDLRTVIQRVQEQATVLAVIENRFHEYDRRLEHVEQKLHAQQTRSKE